MPTGTIFFVKVPEFTYLLLIRLMIVYTVSSYTLFRIICDENKPSYPLMEQMMRVNKKLITACKNEELEAVKKYLNPRKFLIFSLKKADVNAELNDETPLSIAIEKTNLKLIELLLTYGATNVAQSKLDSGLDLACKKNQYDLVKWLLQSGANVDAVDSIGRTPLHTAIEELLHLSITSEKEQSTVNERNQYEIIKYLVRSGANVNAASSTGKTPLHCAADRGTAELVTFLITYGADVNAKEKDINTSEPIFDLSKPRGYANWHELGVDEKRVQRSRFGNTPLHYAAKNLQMDYFPIIKILIGNGADTKATNSNGDTFFHLAISMYLDGSFKQFLNFLIEKKVFLDRKNIYGETPFTLLVRNLDHEFLFEGCRDLFDLLIQNGANFKKIKGNHNTPYSVAQMRGLNRIVKYFDEIEAFANNHKDRSLHSISDKPNAISNDQLTSSFAEQWFANIDIRNEPYQPDEFDLFEVKPHSLSNWFEAVTCNPKKIHTSIVPISKLGTISRSLYTLLSTKYKINSSEAVVIFDNYLGAACPECLSGLTGELLQKIESYKKAEGLMLLGADQSIEKLLNGQCPHCSSDQYYLIWHGDKER